MLCGQDYAYKSPCSLRINIAAKVVYEGMINNIQHEMNGMGLSSNDVADDKMMTRKKTTWLNTAVGVSHLGAH